MGEGTEFGNVDIEEKVAKAKKEYETQLKDLRTQHALGLIEEEKYQEQLYALEVKFLAKKGICMQKPREIHP